MSGRNIPGLVIENFTGKHSVSVKKLPKLLAVYFNTELQKDSFQNGQNPSCN